MTDARLRSIASFPSSGTCSPRTISRIALIGVFLTLMPASAQQFTVLYSFKGGSDGARPWGGVIVDSAGNIYGTTAYGGSSQNCNQGGLGCGTVFKLSPSGKETILHRFGGKGDGSLPVGTLLQGSDGGFFGTTYNGPGPNGFSGVFFSLSRSGKEEILHTFAGGEGTNPLTGVIRDKQGNFFGVTYLGGAPRWYGTAYKLDPSGRTETVLHRFVCSTGCSPTGELVRDTEGNLYGTAEETVPKDSGTVFKLDKTGKQSILYRFPPDGSKGKLPFGVIRDQAGNLYGTTLAGGGCCGTVFELDSTGKETVIYAFTESQGDGALPLTGLVRDSQGNLYGTTWQGGNVCHLGGQQIGCGTVFKIDFTGKETLLHVFKGDRDGQNPMYGPLFLDAAGNLYGTTQYGGDYNNGIVFRVKP